MWISFILLLYLIKSVFWFAVGITKESKTKVGIDGWRDWGGSFWEDGQVNNGGSDNEGGESKGEVHENVT